MKKYNVIFAGLGAIASFNLFFYAMTMSVSLPGAKIVNIHLLHRQDQLFWLSVIGFVISVYFLVKGWKQRGSEIKQDTGELKQKGKKSFRENFLTKRMAVIACLGLVAYVGATQYANYRNSQKNEAAYLKCVGEFYGSTEKGREAHDHACFTAVYLR